MVELTTQLGLRHDSSSPYYPQANGQVEAVNKVLVTMLQRTVGMHKSNWHLMLFSALWAYRTSVKDAIEVFAPQDRREVHQRTMKEVLRDFIRLR